MVFLMLGVVGLSLGDVTSVEGNPRHSIPPFECTCGNNDPNLLDSHRLLLGSNDYLFSDEVRDAHRPNLTRQGFDYERRVESWLLQDAISKYE